MLVCAVSYDEKMRIGCVEIMIGTWVFIAACGALIAGVTVQEKKKNERKIEQNQVVSYDLNDSEASGKVNIRRGFDYEIKDMVKSLNREFKCGINCNSVYLLVSPNYESEYSINDKKYVGYQTLQAQKIGTSDNTYGCDCDRITVYKDCYGNKVIKLIHDIPCFDSGDREYDSTHVLYLFHNNGRIYALYCGEGYRIATLTLFENVKISNNKLKGYLISECFPL